MKDKRPVNLDIGTIRLPITAIVSITHRVSGVFLVAGIALLLWLLDASLASPASYADVSHLLGGFLVKLVVWVVLAALIYHSMAGIRHLIMDLGYGETLQGGVLGAKLVFAASAVLIIIVGALIW